MFLKIAGFELRYQMRNPVFWVAAILFGLMAFGATTSDQIQIGSGGNVHKNAPYAIAQTYLIFSLFYMFVSTAFVASQPGWEHVKTYTDQFSGAYSERPGLTEALRDARLGLYDTLLVYRVDRFARSLKVLVGLLEELETMGVAFRSATEPIDTSTATGRMLIQLLGVFAEFERATIIDRVVAGMERKAARGGWPTSTSPRTRCGSSISATTRCGGEG